MIYFEICHESSQAPYAYRELESIDPIKDAIKMIKEVSLILESPMTCNIEIGNQSTRQQWEPVSKRVFSLSGTPDGSFVVWLDRECFDIKAAKQRIKSTRKFYQI